MEIKKCLNTINSIKNVKQGYIKENVFTLYAMKTNNC